MIQFYVVMMANICLIDVSSVSHIYSGGMYQDVEKWKLWGKIKWKVEIEN